MIFVGKTVDFAAAILTSYMAVCVVILSQKCTDNGKCLLTCRFIEAYLCGDGLKKQPLFLYCGNGAVLCDNISMI